MQTGSPLPHPFWQGSLYIINLLGGGGFKYFGMFTPIYLGKMNPFWRFASFSTGLKLVQPPTNPPTNQPTNPPTQPTNQPNQPNQLGLQIQDLELQSGHHRLLCLELRDSSRQRQNLAFESDVSAVARNATLLPLVGGQCDKQKWVENKKTCWFSQVHLMILFHFDHLLLTRIHKDQVVFSIEILEEWPGSGRWSLTLSRP